MYIPHIAVGSLSKKPIIVIGALFMLLPAMDSIAQIQSLQGSSAFDLINTSIGEAVASIVTQLQAKAVLWLSSFVAIQFIITNIGLIKSGADLEAMFGKLLGSLLWFGFCFYIIDNGSKYIEDVGGSFLEFAGGVVKTGPLDAGMLINQGIAVGSNLIATINKVAGITDFGAVVLGGLCGLFLIIVMAYIASKVFIMKIELALIVMISPLSFAFLGLNALKDQGIAPFKALIALMYRIMILGVIIAAITLITERVTSTIASMYNNASAFSQVTGVGNGVWPIIGAIAAAYFIFGFLAYKSDGIASSLASGSSNLGSSDVAGAAAMGAALGAASMAGGMGLAGGAGKAGQSMGEFMKSMAGGGGSVSNASSSGAGPSASGPAPSRPSMSLGNKAAPAAGNKPPARPPAQSGGGKGSSSSGGGSGSGESAGISGGGSSGSNLESKVDQLSDAMSKQGKKGMKDHMANMNDHVGRDGASTQVSINTHAD